MKALIAYCLIFGFAVHANAQKVYKCTNPDGTTIFSQSECGKDAKELKIDSRSQWQKDQDSRMVTVQDRIHREGKYFDLCKSESSGVNVDCMTHNAEAEQEMVGIIRAGPEQSTRVEKAKQCYAKWFNAATNLTDAVMWRYCFYH